MRQEAYFCTVKELDELGKNNIPRQLISHTHLIYSSPATLAFNSPGAEGFGVKRAGLAVPDSVMLIVSPGCCGRNTSVLSSMRAYQDRFYYLLMDETDIVTGRHLKKIPKAVAEICEGLKKKPSVVMICITCVDALRQEAYFCTVKELDELGKNNIPRQLISHTHLIYSSPATLAFNSPGAEGFGVKRAGLAVPDSVMLIVSPGCCGRNTSVLSSMRAYQDRFYYLLMDETDIVTGRHLKKIPKAVAEICEGLKKKPSVVMICITCVDALLGTDMERVCHKAEEYAGVPVRPCYMYALTREGRKPPMVHVRQSVYSLLEPKKKKGNVVNLLGYFSPLTDDCELYDLLHGAGVKTIHEISRCKDYAQYQTMSEANFNLVLHPEARFAAEDFHDRLKIPYIELRRLYQIDKIASQYRAFAAALGVEFEDEIPRKAAEEAVEKFREIHPDAVFAVGEWMNGDPFELALALVHYGFRVSEIYGTLSGENFVYVKQLAKISPDTKVFSNLEPTMLYYDKSQSGVNMTIGKDAGYYHKECSNVLWNEERQPYGYAGVRRLFEALAEV